MTAPQMNESYPAVASSVPAARNAVAAFASSGGAAGDELGAIRLATSEALSNAVLHAYSGEVGTIQVTAAVVSGDLTVLISDDGKGLQPRTDSPGLGLGLALMADACDELEIAPRSTGGTEVRMRFHLAAAKPAPAEDQSRGSSRAATRPASPRFSTTE